MDITDGTCDIYEKTTPRARKPTLCQACHEVIPAGMKYIRIASLFDGSWDTVKRCQRCEEIHAHLVDLREPNDDIWPNDRLDCGHEYAELHGREPPPEIAALAFALPTD